MSTTLKLKQIPKNKMKEYASYFDEYAYARKNIDTLENLEYGDLWVDYLKKPEILLYQLPWVNMFAGNSDNPNVNIFFEKVPIFELILYPNNEWKTKIREHYEDKIQEITRFTFDPSRLDLDIVRGLVTEPPEGLALKRVDERAAGYIEKHLHRYSRCFGSPEEFARAGIGFCIVDGEKVASQAGSFMPPTKYLEFQVNTDPAYRNMGLATLVSAKLLEFCLLNRLIPVWDAHNDYSIRLAYRLGFSNPQKWDCFFHTGAQERPDVI
jgi:RimJ/RimL family protein N-acetyltransferase